MENNNVMDQDVKMFYDWLSEHSQKCYNKGCNDTLKGCVFGMIGGLLICVAVDTTTSTLIPFINEKLHNRKQKDN